jgi:hypothetical protein
VLYEDNFVDAVIGLKSESLSIMTEGAILYGRSWKVSSRRTGYKVLLSLDSVSMTICSLYENAASKVGKRKSL